MRLLGISDRDGLLALLEASQAVQGCGDVILWGSQHSMSHRSLLALGACSIAYEI